MFTVELRVNGALVGHVYGRNIGDVPGTRRCRYSWEYYEVEQGQVQGGELEHDPGQGIAALAAAVLGKVRG